jgi:membrane complex biogenesis BtpA family protein
LSDFQKFLRSKPIIGMIHMPALPGAPRHTMDLEALVGFALNEAGILERTGCDACIVENVGDAPFFREHVPPITTAAMAIVTREVKRATKMRVGVNMLRNAGAEALSVAAVADADFVRINVVIGAYVTDQGIIQGNAAELARLRKTLPKDVAILGDVHVKHAAPLFDVPIEDAAADLAERGGADAVIVSGARSPAPPSFERVKAVKDAIDKPVFIGSGLGLDNLKEYAERSDGVLIGEVDFKIGGVWGGASDEAAYAKAVRMLRG